MERIGDIGEFGLIERLSRFIPKAPNVIEGIGDDCAVVRVGDRLLLLSCDLSIEGVHFQRGLASPTDIGWKSAMSSLSDIAAMGGAPLFCLVALACPADTEVSFVMGVYTGINNAVGQAGALIIGGDTSRVGERFGLDITVIGETIGTRYLSRRGAQVGDYLAITGRTGLSAAGLDALLTHRSAPALVRAHHHPVARFTEGQWLCTCADVHAMIDISDGLVQDAGHLAKGAGLGVDINPDLVPINSELLTYCDAHGLDPLNFALRGGEDYELAFAISGKDAEGCLRSFRREFRTPLTLIGRFTDSWRGVRVGGEPYAHGGYEHFSGKPTP